MRAITESARNCVPLNACIRESSSLFNKVERFLLEGHEVGAAMTRDYDCAAGIAHACSTHPVPTLEKAVQEPARKSVSGAENVVNVHRKRGGMQFLARFQINR